MPKGIYQRKPKAKSRKQILTEQALKTNAEQPKGKRKTQKEIAKEVGLSTKRIQQIKKAMEKEQKPQETQTEKLEIEQTPPATLPGDLDETLPQIKDEIEPSLIAAAATGMITAQDLKYVFQSVNSIIPENYRRPQEAMQILGNVWEKPLNRIMEKYLDENIDLYVAIIVTIVIFAPAPVKYMREKTKEKPKQKQETEKKENGKFS